MNILMSAAAGGNALMPIIWIVVLFAFMYFFMIRPQPVSYTHLFAGGTPLL